MTTESSSALLSIPGESPDRSPSASPKIYTPPSESSAIDAENLPKRRPSPLSLSSRGLEPVLPVSGDVRFTGSRVGSSFGSAKQPAGHDSEEEDDDDEEEEEKMQDRPGMHRPTDGRSETPLLKEERGRPSHESPLGSARPTFVSRRSTFRSRSPDFEAQSATKKKYIYAAFFLGLSLVTFVVQTETAKMVSDMGWKKSYCMLWMTHGSWSLLWPVTFLILRIQKRKMSWKSFWRKHKQMLRTTAQMVRTQDLHLMTREAHDSPVPYMLRTTAFVTTALTIAGGSWYVAVNMTTPSDLTAIYNCSAFFAYAFSIPILGDKIRFDKVFSVLVAIAGVIIVAYWDTDPNKASEPTPVAEGDGPPPNRALGNIIIGIGSILYGLYEVMYKKMACPPEGCSPGRGMVFALTVGSMIGSFTLFVLWIPLPILHFAGWEVFEFPTGTKGWVLLVSVIANATFSGSFLVLISLTSPVLSSVAALLTIFLVAIVDTVKPDGKPLTKAAIVGGILIIGAFLLLSWSTYRELNEERKKQLENEEAIVDDEDEDEEDIEETSHLSS